MLVAKNGGNKRAHHFAHLVSNAGFTTESQIHATAKYALRDRIESALSRKEEIPISWKCPDVGACSWQTHTGNLLKCVDDVKLEQQIRDIEIWIRPDLTLLKAGAPKIFVEIVVTSKPKATTYEYADKWGARVLIFNVEKFEDITYFKRGYSILLNPRRCRAPAPWRRLKPRNCPKPPKDGPLL